MNKTTYNIVTLRESFKGGGPRGPTPEEIQREKYQAALRARQGVARAGTNQKERTGRKNLTRTGYGVYIPKATA
jgi:hypothetical protein